MHYVVKTEQVAHLWANQAQSRATNSTNTLFFRDKVIFSYSSSFPIARHLDLSNILYTSRNYSHTTSTHKSQVWCAVYTKTKFLIVDDVLANDDETHKRNLIDLRQQFATALEKALSARKYTCTYMDTAFGLIESHTRYRNLFGMHLDTPLLMSDDWKEKAKARIECQKEETKRIEAKHKAQREAKRLEHAKRYEAWKQGEIVYTLFHDFPVALRVSADGLNVETSRGADVPVNHARRLWAVIQRITASGVPYEHNGHTEHVGAFRVDSINAEGTLRAGCHVIEYPAMKNLADKLGWV